MPTNYQEYESVLQEPRLSGGAMGVKGIFKIAIGNMAYYPVAWPLTYPAAAVGMVIGGVSWGLGKFVLRDGEDKEKLISNGKDLIWSSVALSVPIIGPTALIADGCVNIATGQNYGAEGMANTYHNAKVFVHNTNEYAQDKYDQGKNFATQTKERVNQNVQSVQKAAQDLSNMAQAEYHKTFKQKKSDTQMPDIENQIDKVKSEDNSMYKKVVDLMNGIGLKVGGATSKHARQDQEKTHTRVR